MVPDRHVTYHWHAQQAGSGTFVWMSLGTAAIETLPHVGTLCPVTGSLALAPSKYIGVLSQLLS